MESLIAAHTLCSFMEGDMESIIAKGLCLLFFGMAAVFCYILIVISGGDED